MPAPGRARGCAGSVPDAAPRGVPTATTRWMSFPTPREGARALRTIWAGATRALERAEAAQQQVDRRGRLGQSRTGYATQARRQWRRAERIWDQAAAAETAWGHVRAAFEDFTPEGLLNDRHRVAAVVAAALPHLTGPTWAKTRRLLQRPGSFTSLDQVQRRWAGLGWAGSPRSGRPCWTWKDCAGSRGVGRGRRARRPPRAPGRWLARSSGPRPDPMGRSRPIGSGACCAGCGVPGAWWSVSTVGCGCSRRGTAS